MILDYLNLSESTVGEVNVEPIVNSYVTPDSTGLAIIQNEGVEYMIKLEEGVMLCEQMIKAYDMQGKADAAIQLQEGMVSDFFNKIVQMLKTAWAKLQGFFDTLFKNIGLAVGDIEKIITKYKKDYESKDFTDFEYKGHKWKALDAAKLGSEADALLKSEEKNVQAIKLQMKEDDKTEPTSFQKEHYANSAKDNQKSYEDRKSKNNYINKLLKGDLSKETTPAEARQSITEAIKGDEDTIKNFDAGISLTAMIDFVKAFKNNKVLTDAKKAVDKLYAEAIKTATQVRDNLQRVANGDDKKLVTASAKSGVPLAKVYISNMQNALNAYDDIMGIYIDLEKSKFDEFKRVIIAAIKYKPKAEK